MEYDYHPSRAGPLPYESRIPLYPSATSSAAPSSTAAAPHISSFYPKIGQHGQPFIPPAVATRAPPYHQPPTIATASASPPLGTGIRVAIKQEYSITPLPQLSPQMVEIPRSNFQFDFDLEKNIIAELEKEQPDWSLLGLETVPVRSTENKSSLTLAADPLVMKYIASGLNREAVPLAVANYGDNPAKIREFANAYTILREMGFSANNVVEGLLMYDNDTDKVLVHFLNSSSS